jgi:hypothetical protein
VIVAAWPGVTARGYSKVLTAVKDERRLYTCPQCGGAQTITE